MTDISVVRLGDELSRKNVRDFASGQGAEFVEGSTKLDDLLKTQSFPQARILVLTDSDEEVTRVRELLAAHPDRKLRDVDASEILDGIRKEEPSTYRPQVSAGREVMIKVSRGHSVPLSELEESERWGAHPNWIGQQALERYRSTGDTGE